MPALRTRDTHPLEVTTDAPVLPALSIISPTPRTFSFPPTHNLSADSPYSSPSHTPDLYPPTCSSPTQYMRTLSPIDTLCATGSQLPTPTSHKRRKSTSTSMVSEMDHDRRPKKGDQGYIKRPENAFILFRRKCCEERQAALDEAAAEGAAPSKKQRQADLSKTISLQWKTLPTEERQYWEQMAKERKKEHEQMYPNYVYRPQRTREKDGRSKSRKPTKGRRATQDATEVDNETDSESVSFVLPMMAARHPHGRSASAPTPPPYQSIQIPNVYQLTPSCPTSPSLLPMISRRSGHPHHSPLEEQPLFDYMPATDGFVPPPQSFGQAGQLEATISNSEYLRHFYPQATSQGSDPTQLISPSSSSSSSSGPSTPDASPYTPSSAILAHSFANLNTGADPHGFMVPPAMSQADLDLHLEMQMQNEYASYNWENPQLWPGHVAFGCEGGAPVSETLLGSDDFDLNSIPSVQMASLEKESSSEVGLMMDMEHLGMGVGMEGVHHQQLGHHGQLLGFDELMAGHGF
ncbi:hypothetical protein BDN72DRAFT_861977 [Pluteus cervinus]|uniref:Uncharacterized protein n=1 Tax=Pluteus cervinus TaxID=181527 RepID=A0ACD3ACJ2_9AGAR|nr:hypothetical protein BDN72DRAFT_861977 [Pluteus cervinus]